MDVETHQAPINALLKLAPLSSASNNKTIGLSALISAASWRNLSTLFLRFLTKRGSIVNVRTRAFLLPFAHIQHVALPPAVLYRHAAPLTSSLCSLEKIRNQLEQ